MVAYANVTDPTIIGEVISLTGASLLTEIKLIVPAAAESPEVYNAIVLAGQLAYAAAYKYVYYASIGKYRAHKV